MNAGRQNMSIEKIAYKIMPALDRSLRHIYPENYHVRCFQAAVALDTYLSEMGFDSKVVAGDFEVAVRNSMTGACEFHGFQSKTEAHSHFWVEAEGRLLDIMPLYIPRSCRSVSMIPPMVALKLSQPLPQCFRYTVKDPAPRVRSMLFPEDIATITVLVSDMRRRLAKKGVSRSTKPVLMTSSCISKLARKHDPWAVWVMKTFSHAPRDGSGASFVSSIKGAAIVPVAERVVSFLSQPVVK